VTSRLPLALYNRSFYRATASGQSGETSSDGTSTELANSPFRGIIFVTAGVLPSLRPLGTESVVPLRCHTALPPINHSVNTRQVTTLKQNPLRRRCPSDDPKMPRSAPAPSLIISTLCRKRNLNGDNVKSPIAGTLLSVTHTIFAHIITIKFACSQRVKTTQLVIWTSARGLPVPKRN
jgi:hypothetical protein